MIHFNGLGSLPASANTGRSYFPVFSRRKYWPLRAAVNHHVLTDNWRVKLSFTIMGGARVTAHFKALAERGCALGAVSPGAWNLLLCRRHKCRKKSPLVWISAPDVVAYSRIDCSHGFETAKPESFRYNHRKRRAMSLFVSYSHKQSEWVHSRLIPVLRAAGAEVIVDIDHLQGR